jgi:hypothetical protein
LKWWFIKLRRHELRNRIEYPAIFVTSLGTYPLNECEGAAWGRVFIEDLSQVWDSKSKLIELCERIFFRSKAMRCPVFQSISRSPNDIRKTPPSSNRFTPRPDLSSPLSQPRYANHGNTLLRTSKPRDVCITSQRG